MLKLVEEHYPLPDILPEQEKRKAPVRNAEGNRKRKKTVCACFLLQSLHLDQINADASFAFRCMCEL